MTSEINFLVDLILNHKLPLATKKVIAERLKLVTENTHASPVAPRSTPVAIQTVNQQAPSTLANLAKHGLAAPPLPIQEAYPEVPGVVVSNAATAAAMASRNEAISASLSGKVDKVSGRPRKF